MYIQSCLSRNQWCILRIDSDHIFYLFFYTLQALIFDSKYDSYKGVIVFCRIKEGTVKKGTPMLMMATGAKAEVVEVGTFGAGQFIPCDALEAGMVGYITASLKNVKDTRVGDTITNAENPSATDVSASN